MMNQIKEIDAIQSILKLQSQALWGADTINLPRERVISLLDTLHETTNALIDRLDGLTDQLLDIESCESVSREELANLFWESEEETYALNDEKSVSLRSCYSRLIKEQGSDELDDLTDDLVGHTSQERFINGFYKGVKYAATGELKI
ncbi:hypothetical protein [uncultured Abiotrophia sp.]|uniref:hypothetical protein n=1 Tax=uncultured Abiotrophia sp. TaxID=316094 RepID=UPI0028E2D4F4|nr:hypothetical protein [uncultured Abiotrophia sp.]